MTDAGLKFDALIAEVKACNICPRMADSQRVLSRAAGALDARVMFIGEAPGRLGADGSGVPFHGDKAGANFEDLLSQVHLDRYTVFVTNAVLCNPKDDKGNNSPPKKVEIEACSNFLRRQVDIVNPAIVASLGSAALHAASLIEPHGLNLRDHVRTAHNWYNRLLIPSYHPGQRAMLHRSFANQLSDYQFIAEQTRRLTKKKRRSVGGSATLASVAMVDLITRLVPTISYFALHKIFYLAEVQSVSRFGHRITNAFIIRQKDGPYCTDLHLLRLKKAIPDLRIMQKGGSILLSRTGPGLFDPLEASLRLSPEAIEVVKATVARYGKIPDNRLKAVAYLTAPMRSILRQERTGRNMYNAPIDFSVGSNLVSE